MEPGGPVEPGILCGRYEHSPTQVLVPKRLSRRAREHPGRARLIRSDFPQPARRGRGERHVAPRVCGFQSPDLTAAILPTHKEAWTLAELHVRPGEPDRLADPQPGLSKQLEE